MRSRHVNSGETPIESCISIKTEIGILWGRDCIFLDRVVMNLERASDLILEGTINTNIVKEFVLPQNMPVSGELPYRLRFSGVLAVQILEYDTWCDLHENDQTVSQDPSSFEEVIDSRWKASLNGKVTKPDRHFRVSTYDDIIDVICRDYELTFNPDGFEQPDR